MCAGNFNDSAIPSLLQPMVIDPSVKICGKAFHRGPRLGPGSRPVKSPSLALRKIQSERRTPPAYEMPRHLLPPAVAPPVLTVVGEKHKGTVSSAACPGLKQIPNGRNWRMVMSKPNVKRVCNQGRHDTIPRRIPVRSPSKRIDMTRCTYLFVSSRGRVGRTKWGGMRLCGVSNFCVFSVTFWFAAEYF